MPDPRTAQDLDLGPAADLSTGLGHDPPGTASLETVLRRVIRLLEVPATGLIVRQTERWQVAASSDPTVLRVQRAQERGQAGPGVDAATHGVPSPVDDLTATGIRQRWPQYVPVALACGVRAAVGVPVLAEGEVIGALELLDHRPRLWETDLLERATTLADLAGVVVLLIARLQTESHRAGQLAHALDSRVVIEQAKGVIACSRGIDMDSAFRVLRRYARDRNAKIQRVAAAVVTLGLRP
jgi:GAF domain-containing protein